MAAGFHLNWSGPMKRFRPPGHDWQRAISRKLNLRLEQYLCYGRTKYFDSSCPPRETAPVLADGNCFFRALSLVITGAETYHLSVRTAVTKHVEVRADMYRTFLQSRGGLRTYVRNMRRPREWATDTEILAAATLLDTIIEICTEIPGPAGHASRPIYQWQTFQPLNNPDPSLPRIYISHRQDHFEPILDIDIHRR